MIHPQGFADRVRKEMGDEAQNAARKPAIVLPRKKIRSAARTRFLTDSCEFLVSSRPGLFCYSNNDDMQLSLVLAASAAFFAGKRIRKKRPYHSNPASY
jgi:hypothetical protein